MPPRFDFARSDNLKSVEVSWPAPERFSDGSGNSIGYKNAVIFPLRIVPKDAGKPVVVRLELDYAICEKLCVPASAKVELAVGTAASTHDAPLAASEARVPRPAALGAPGPLAITSVQRAPEGAHGRIIVEVAAARDDAVELFAEGPTPDWALPVPAPVGDAAADKRRFAFEIDGLPPGAHRRGGAAADRGIGCGGHRGYDQSRLMRRGGLGHGGPGSARPQGATSDTDVDIDKNARPPRLRGNDHAHQGR